MFLAYAKVYASRVGPYPLPLFVKLDQRDRIQREHGHYLESTTAFIPFYARPNLDLKRCLMGSTRGIIVGDFVERSESLKELVKRGDSQSVIDSLFQDALRGWRAQPYGGDEDVVTQALYSRCVPEHRLRQKRRRLDAYSRIAKSLGSVLDFHEVARRLDKLPAIRHRRGYTHGDLHSANVRGRAGEAILIDFHSVGPGALSTDPATLEVSLSLEFECATEAEWHATMSQLYSLENLRTVPRPKPPMTSLNPLWDAVRQIRRYGLADQLEDHEYCRAVAIQLLRKATYRRNDGEDLSRRPFLIKLASSIVLALEQEGSANDGAYRATG